VSEPRDTPALAELQRLLGRAIRHHAPLTGDAAMRAELEPLIQASASLRPIERAEIYREQFWLRHRDSLYEDYPALSYLLGEQAFEAFCRAYLAAHPPASYTLRDLGNDIAAFAASYDGFEPELAAAAGDVARYELAFVHIFDAADAPVLTLDRVQHLGPQALSEARLLFQDHLALLDLSYPVHHFRTALKRFTADDLASGRGPERTIAPRAVVVALWRGGDFKVHHREIDRTERDLVVLLRGGHTVVEACQSLIAGLDAASAAALGTRLSAWLRGWAKRGWLRDVA
jgi:hypothetical protein